MDPASQSTISVAQAPGDTVIDGVFDVDGHGLYLNCQGSGSPTIVYMPGSIGSPGTLAHANGAFAQRALSDEYRVCVYDRRNVGLSETVDAPQLPEDAIGDMRGLLAAAGVEPRSRSIARLMTAPRTTIVATAVSGLHGLGHAGIDAADRGYRLRELGVWSSHGLLTAGPSRRDSAPRR